jgi:hypothetical protein
MITDFPMLNNNEQEDAQLLILIKEFGLEKWDLISSKLEGRSQRQCCER